MSVRAGIRPRPGADPSGSEQAVPISTLLTRKLRGYAHLSDADARLLTEAMGPGRQIAARADLIEEGDEPRTVHVILDGWACRYRQLADGRRQIVALMLPGDPCDPQGFLLDRIDHTIGALTSVVLAEITGRAMGELLARSPALRDAFHREMLAKVAIHREWIVSLGRRTAVEKVAHLFCELNARLCAVGLAEGPSCPLPLTQADLADALGLTSVHVNRSLRDLRGRGLITLKNRRLTIHDGPGLAGLAQFDPAYLHLRRTDGHPAPGPRS